MSSTSAFRRKAIFVEALAASVNSANYSATVEKLWKYMSMKNNANFPKLYTSLSSEVSGICDCIDSHPCKIVILVQSSTKEQTRFTILPWN
jgi:hypothetical protein